MNLRSNKIQPISKPMQGPSSQDFLSQSIVKSVHNPSNSSIFMKNQNNNALPDIQTDMLASFNPQAFEMKRQDTTRGRQMSQRSNFISPRFQSQNKAKVNFSYNNNYEQHFNRSPLTPTNSISIHRYNQLKPTQINLMSRSNNLNVVRPHSSLESTKDYSNLSEMTKLKKPLQSVTSYPLSGFQKKETDLKKVHKLGKKSKPFQSLNKNNMGQQIKLIPTQMQNIQKDQNQTSFEVVQSPRRNISSISIERSEYVFMSEKKQEQKINIEPQTYVYSNSNITPKYKAKPFGFNLIENNTSMILPIEQQQDSQMHMPVLTDKSSNLSKSRGMKSPGKIDNRVYLQQQKPVSLSSMSMLRKLDSKDSRLSEDEQMNKISKISKISHRKRTNQDQKSPQKQKNIVSPFAKLQQYQQIQKLQKQHNQQRQSLQQRIFSLQEQLRNKQEENNILRNKLQNTQLQKQIQSQYEKLQIVSKLNQVEIKKLRNQIKMFKIKQKIYQNKQKEQTQIISSLKQQVKSLKNSSGIMSLNLKSRFLTGY